MPMSMRKRASIAFAKPFRPFCVAMNDGTRFEIRDSHTIHVGRTRCTISGWTEEVNGTSANRERTILLSDIEAIGPRVTYARQTGGGQMTYEEIFEYVDREPFKPFQIRMVSGRTFEVRHPENIRVSEESVYVFLHSERDERLVERVIMLGTSLIESVEHIDSPVAQD